jgi:hypothetical protein
LSKDNQLCSVQNTIIHVFLKFHISCHDDKSKMTMYRERIESYIHDKPNLYESIFFFISMNQFSFLDVKTSTLTLSLLNITLLSSRDIPGNYPTGSYSFEESCINFAYLCHTNFASTAALPMIETSHTMVEHLLMEV